MNRPTKPDEILAMPAVERDAYAADVCMGLSEPEEGKKIESFDELFNNAFWHIYQPSQPTEKGMAQCWDLEDKFQLSAVGNYGGVFYAVVDMFDGETVMSGFEEANRQKVIETAAILCAIQRKKNGPNN